MTERKFPSRSRERFAACVGSYDTLCLGGGGMRCFAYLGAYKIFQNRFCEKGETVADLFDNFVGASGGSLNALMLAAGFSAEEIELKSVDVEVRKKLFKKNAWDLISPKSGATGLNDGSALKEYMRSVLIEKGILGEDETDLTFGQFKERTGKSLAFSVSYIYVDDMLLSSVKPRFEYVGRGPEGHNELVLEACSDSMRIVPYIQPRYDAKNKRFAMDGGFFSNVPADAFDPRRTFVIRTCTTQELERKDLVESMHASSDRIAYVRDLYNGKLNIVDVFKSVLFAYMHAIDEKNDGIIPKEVHDWATIRMAVPVSYLDDFYMPPQKIAKIVDMGRRCTELFLAKLTVRALLSVRPEKIKRD